MRRGKGWIPLFCLGLTMRPGVLTPGRGYAGPGSVPGQRGTGRPGLSVELWVWGRAMT